MSSRTSSRARYVPIARTTPRRYSPRQAPAPRAPLKNDARPSQFAEQERAARALSGDQTGHATEGRLPAHHRQSAHSVSAGVGDLPAQVADRVAEAVGAHTDGRQLTE